MIYLKRLALAAAGLCAAPVTADTLKFAHFVAPSHTLTEAVITPLAEAVAASGLSIAVYPAGKLGAAPADQYRRALQGVADIVWGLQGYTSSQFPRSMLPEWPGAKPAGLSGADFLWNGWEAGLLTAEYPGTLPLALWTAEDAVLITGAKPVRQPRDLAGMKIRTSSSISALAVEALGASPVQMPAGDVYNALQTGLIDGVIIGSSGISDFKFDEVLGHVATGIPLGHQSFFVVANEKRLARLPAAQRAALLAASGRALSRRAEAAWLRKGAAALAKLREREGVVIDLTPQEAAAFAEILLPLTQAAPEAGLIAAFTGAAP